MRSLIILTSFILFELFTTSIIDAQVSDLVMVNETHQLIGFFAIEDSSNHSNLFLRNYRSVEKSTRSGSIKYYSGHHSLGKLEMYGSIYSNIIPENKRVGFFHSYYNSPTNFFYFTQYAGKEGGELKYGPYSILDYSDLEFRSIHSNKHLGNYLFVREYDKTRRIPIHSSADDYHEYWTRIYPDSTKNEIVVYPFAINAFSGFRDSVAIIGTFEGIFRTEDLGKTKEKIFTESNQVVEFLFDSDSLHVYAINTNNKLKVSNNYGRLSSWHTEYLPIIPHYWSLDTKIPGLLYVSDLHNIYRLEDYGAKKTLIYTTTDRITGLYKKPGEELVYISYLDRLDKLESDLVRTIYRVPTKKVYKYNEISFPYKIGNQFHFQKVEFSDSLTYEIFILEVTEITKDSMDNIEIKFGSTSSDDVFGSLIINEQKDLIATNWFNRKDIILLKNNSLQLKPWWANTLKTNEPYEIGIIRDVIVNNNLISGQHPLFSLDYYNSPHDTLSKFGYSNSEALWSNKFGFVQIHNEKENVSYQLVGARINETFYGEEILINSSEKLAYPTTITLQQNYPNPFNPSTVISYQLTGNSMVSLRVFDALGREVAVLVDELKSAGRHQVTFDAAGLASGVYYYVLNADEQILTKKLTLIK